MPSLHTLRLSESTCPHRKASQVLHGVRHLLSCASAPRRAEAESSMPHGVVMEVVLELYLEWEASLKGEKGQVFQEWIQHGNGDPSMPFRVWSVLAQERVRWKWRNLRT